MLFPPRIISFLFEPFNYATLPFCRITLRPAVIAAGRPPVIAGKYFGLLCHIGAALLVFCGGHAFAADKNALKIVTWEGPYAKSQQEAYVKPWRAATGAKTRTLYYDGTLAEIKAQAESGNIKWDVVDVQLSDADSACEQGLIEKIDPAFLQESPDGIVAEEDFIPGTLHECAVGNVVWSTVLAYDQTAVKNIPATMADFFDLKKFPGKRGMRRNAKVNLEFALIASGVSARDVYQVLQTPEGIDRAFAKLDQIKDHIVWWDVGPEAIDFLHRGTVSITTAFNGLVFDAVVGQDMPFEIIWDGQVYDVDAWVVLKGAKNKDLAFDFIKYSTGTKPLADQASWISYGPARKSSMPLVGAYQDDPTIGMRRHLPTHPDNMQNAVFNDYKFWAAYSDVIDRRFEAWIEAE